LISCKRDHNGNLLIPDQFWRALESKIRADRFLLQDQSAETRSIPSSATGLSKKDIVNIHLYNSILHVPLYVRYGSSTYLWGEYGTDMYRGH
jgi:hypothetical protein